MCINRNHRDLCFGDACPCAVDAFGIDNHLHGDARAPESDCSGVKLDNFSHVDGSLKIDAIDTRGYPSMETVVTRLDVARLVDMGEDDAAENGALMVRIARHHEDAQCKPRSFDRWKISGHSGDGSAQRSAHRVDAFEKLPAHK